MVELYCEVSIGYNPSVASIAMSVRLPFIIEPDMSMTMTTSCGPGARGEEDERRDPLRTLHK